MRLRELYEYGRIVKGVNTTDDVDVNSISKEAGKFGFKVDKDGTPPTLSKKVKGKSSNVLFNLGLTESVAIKFERGDDYDVLHIKEKGKSRVEVRGKKGYESGNYDSKDKLHKLLDKLKKAANISELMNGETVVINPKHPDGPGAIDATTKEGEKIPNPKNTFLAKADTAYDHYKIGTNLANLKSVPKGANYDEPDIMITPYAGAKEMKYLRKQLQRIGYKTQDAAGHKDAQFDDDEVEENFAKDSITAIKLIKKYHQTGDEQDAFAAIKHGWNFIKNPKMRSIIVNLVKKVSTENGYPNWNDTVAYIKKNTGIDVSNVNENFADGKKKGKSRPGRVKKSGASCNGSVTALRKRAKNSSGEKAKMYHWCANMKSGKKKK